MWLQPHTVGACCLSFLGVLQGSPPGASLPELVEATAGTALRSAARQGKQQAAKHTPILLLAPCPQPRHASGHRPSAATSLPPAGPPGMSLAVLSS